MPAGAEAEDPNELDPLLMGEDTGVPYESELPEDAEAPNAEDDEEELPSGNDAGFPYESELLLDGDDTATEL